jgi:ribosomal protein S18 acetylase RimI-like enzyme
MMQHTIFRPVLIQQDKLLSPGFSNTQYSYQHLQNSSNQCCSAEESSNPSQLRSISINNDEKSNNSQLNNSNPSTAEGISDDEENVKSVVKSEGILIEYSQYSYRCHGCRVTFRSMLRQDLPAVMQLHDLLFPVKYTLEFYENLLNPHIITLLGFIENEKDGKYGDLVCLATAKIKVKNSACRKISTGYILTIGCHPLYRKQGLGLYILKSINQLIQSNYYIDSYISLHVKADNIAAIKMYENAGFMIEETLPEHYLIDNQYYAALVLVMYIKKKQSQRWCAVQ